MKFFSIFLVILGIFHGVDALACRPNINSVQNELALIALSSAYEEKKSHITDITKVQVKDIKMFWVKNDLGKDCPDKYVISFELEYKECFSLEATVTSFKGENSVEFGGTYSCTEHP